VTEGFVIGGEKIMREELLNLRDEAISAISQAASVDQLEAVKIRLLGKKGELTAVLKQMGKLDASERPAMGELANGVRDDVQNQIEQRMTELYSDELEKRMAAESVDITLPGVKLRLGKKHPLTKVLDEAKEIFIGMGFSIAEGPEIELSEYNFTKLNTRENHPSRDRQDTFYFDDDDELCLRTQTSPVQARVMESQPLPIRIISPGRVFRKDEVDATHMPMFHQIEGLVIDRNITMGDLKGTLNLFCEELFGGDTKTRFRPHNFPFTEPSCEVDLQCFECRGSGCRVCKGEGWIEMLGAGMVHPNVLEMCGIDHNIYSGFAFGIGLDRITMMRYKINDLRLLFENDQRFLEQF
jgi:phenylalanyl-tRNA synthetase alpha chain